MNWDTTVDVLIVGSGNGGLTAALCCYEMGAKNTLVIEKADKYGGTSSYSGGGIWIPCNQYAQAAGAQDSLQDASAYLHAVLPHERIDTSLIDVYLKTAPEMLSFLTERTQVKYRDLPMYPDYFSDAPGAKSGHRSLEPEPFSGEKLGKEWDNLTPTNHQMYIQGVIGITQAEAHEVYAGLPGWKSLAAKLVLQYLLDIPWRLKTRMARRITCGAAGIARLRASMMDRDLPLWLNTRLVDLVYENGRVEGAVVEKAGKRMAIRATRGVILAAGGFEKNQAMREKYLPKPTNAAWSAAAWSNTGDAILAGEKIGARLSNMNSAWWCTTICAPDLLPQLSITEKSYPGSCVVNKNGRRIANESQNYMSWMLEAFARHTPENPSAPAYMVFDARFRRSYLTGPLLKSSMRPDFILPKKWFESKFIAKANTIADLARQIDVDVKGLEKTIADMNRYAQAGKDEEFNRGEALYDRYYGDPRISPNPCLAPIVEAPFYAMKIELGDFATNGGLVTDADARVRNTNGEAISGLYAVGNTSAGLLVTYPGPGSTLGPAMTFAYRAARHLCNV
ncbi:MAG: FAD-dependent oxidoreductase [Proteobacteria bacterium]|nr:FAD-dependent oxidoreductase [Pseudomonadota bacterium]HQR02821.1 FAD-dependent oxidoreductase [Rhodocyclaceae bacterium]